MADPSSQSAAQVLHVASHSINVGDGALIAVIQDRLRAVTDRPIAFRNLDIVDFESAYGGRALDLRELSEQNLIVVGGGGTIGNRRGNTVSGMAFPMSGAQIRSTPTPLAYVGVGYNLFEGIRLRHAEALGGVIEACRERGFPFSVRNDGSLARLRSALGAIADDVVEVPDPGFFVKVPTDYDIPQFSGRRPCVLIQLAGDNPGFRFGAVPGDLARRVINKLPFRLGRSLATGVAKLVRWLVEEKGAEVVFAPHVTTDLRLTADVLRLLPTEVERKYCRVLGVPHPSRASLFFSAYSRADLVVGMRGHSVICACGLRVPCVALSTHPKVEGFMRACGLEDWVVPFASGFEDVLRARCDDLLTSPGEYLRIRDERTTGFEARLDSFLRRCVDLID